jgi:NTP pyrophosphatase (non-canonical NTP hydrolase)
MNRIDFLNSLCERELNFLDAFEAVQRQVHDTQKNHGFSAVDDDLAEMTERYGVPPALVDALKSARVGQKLMLITSELAEGLEADRKNKTADDHIPEFTGMEAELADAVIRIMNLATGTKSRLAEAIIAKAKYNETRPFKHGDKKY